MLKILFSIELNYNKKKKQKKIENDKNRCCVNILDFLTLLNKKKKKEP